MSASAALSPASRQLCCRALLLRLPVPLQCTRPAYGAALRSVGPCGQLMAVISSSCCHRFGFPKRNVVFWLNVRGPVVWQCLRSPEVLPGFLWVICCNVLSWNPWFSIQLLCFRVFFLPCHLEFGFVLGFFHSDNEKC